MGNRLVFANDLIDARAGFQQRLEPLGDRQRNFAAAGLDQRRVAHELDGVAGALFEIQQDRAPSSGAPSHSTSGGRFGAP